jgi:mercuric ion transport protein
MPDNKILLRVGLCGMVLAAISWLTPILFVALHTVGLPVSRAWIDSVSAPALAIFMGLTMYALVRMGRLKIVARGCCYVPIPEELRIPPTDK